MQIVVHFPSFAPVVYCERSQVSRVRTYDVEDTPRFQQHAVACEPAHHVVAAQ